MMNVLFRLGLQGRILSAGCGKVEKDAVLKVKGPALHPSLSHVPLLCPFDPILFPLVGPTLLPSTAVPLKAIGIEGKQD